MGCMSHGQVQGNETSSTFIFVSGDYDVRIYYCLTSTGSKKRGVRMIILAFGLVDAIKKFQQVCIAIPAQGKVGFSWTLLLFHR
jgi:hypothetical protein